MLITRDSFRLLGRYIQIEGRIGDRVVKVPKGTKVYFYVTADSDIYAVYQGKVLDVIDVEKRPQEDSFSAEPKEKTRQCTSHRPGSNNPWTRFVINYKYRREETKKRQWLKTRS